MFFFVEAIALKRARRGLREPEQLAHFTRDLFVDAMRDRKLEKFTAPRSLENFSMRPFGIFRIDDIVLRADDIIRAKFELGSQLLAKKSRMKADHLPGLPEPLSDKRSEIPALRKSDDSKRKSGVPHLPDPRFEKPESRSHVDHILIGLKVIKIPGIRHPMFFFDFFGKWKWSIGRQNHRVGGKMRLKFSINSPARFAVAMEKQNQLLRSAFGLTQDIIKRKLGGYVNAPGELSHRRTPVARETPFP